MAIVIFELWGKFAHFRKFYTNSSSLSYSVPPRTTIEGIIAALLGYERDSYYEILDAANLHVAVRKMGRTRKVMQSINYMKATSSGELNSPKEHTQIPFELLVGYNNIRYRFYITHEDKEILDEISKRIMKNRPVFPLYFGSAPFSCYIDFIDKLEWIWNESNEYVPISTVLNNDKIQDIDINNMEGYLIKERMPRDFGEDRTIEEVTTYIYEDEGKFLKAKIDGKYARLSNGENIVFL
ncbi:type I-B CRISPR-associated protein Cas5b [Schnuerera ultunensis]|uniref:CRISPR-associated protein Cas5, Hmari subtype n=1 Tax=[Clostridium] ultunense Esp TaxID=1288971 RepID=A0A1M4PQG2_9FIRM|nr:type I-B CRISPR-associated protein Cas5b [Schnuerera ultunensis]SHD77701.1 CRISPR-associated protein Cas5, Hmari subtype [[Clostridium] ultunense Esp]